MNEDISIPLEVTRECSCGKKMVQQYSTYTSAIDSRMRNFNWWCACETTVPGTKAVLMPVAPTTPILTRWQAVNPGSEASNGHV